MSNYKYIAQDIEKEKIKACKELDNIRIMKKGLEGKYPKKTIICSKNGDRYKWYATDGKSKDYIPKNKRQLAEELAKKKYYAELVLELESKIKACDSFLNVYNSMKRSADDLLLNPGYSELLFGLNETVSAFNISAFNDKKGNAKVNSSFNIQKLRDEKYNVEFDPNSDYLNQKYADSLTIQGTQGKQLRSKSEAIIDLMLFKSGLDYKYEYPIKVEGRVFYPDFTIFSRKMNKLIYWEHFGMMDDEKYSQKAFEKMIVYSNNEILLGSNLIATFETMENPLNISEVENIISRYF